MITIMYLLYYSSITCDLLAIPSLLYIYISHIVMNQLVQKQHFNISKKISKKNKMSSKKYTFVVMKYSN